MKKKLGVLIALILVAVALFCPAAKVNVHNSISEEIAAQFPAAISLGDVLIKGTCSLPTDTVSQLALVQMQSPVLAVGIILMVIAAALALLKKRGAAQAAIATSIISAVLLFAFALQFNNVCSSLLFGYMLESQFWIYIPAVAAALMAGYLFLVLHQDVKNETGDRVWESNEQTSKICLPFGENTWRMAGGVLAVLAALCIFLPYVVVSVPDTITESVSANTINRSVSMLTYTLDQEDTLNADVVEAGESTNVLTGDLGVLNDYSNQSTSNNNIKYIFQNPTANSASNIYILIAVITMVLGAVFAFWKKADRWFSLCLEAVAAIAVTAAAISLMTISENDFYAKAGRQLVYLGLGHVTVVPMVMMLLAWGSFLCGSMCVKRANVPYFINPMPQKVRIRVIAVTLAVLSIVTIFLPSVSFTFYKAGGTSTVSTAEISGIQALTFQVPDDVAHPKNKKGATMYEDEPKEGVLSAASVEGTMTSIAASNSICSWAALIITLIGIVMLLTNRAQKPIMVLFGAAFLVRGIQWILLTFQMPAAIGESTGTIYLYLSMPLELFAMFFSAFVHLNEVPKKYRLFLMVLPFLVSVFLFSYLPLAGWRYAFYNYKFGQPWSQQEFVGFKWFEEMFTNSGHFTNIVRVMKNTLGMSLLGLAFSWLPMVFAIFLNEINNARFKKFVQIFTTLPNFISWALVFSFAMAMFSMETGIFSKFMLAIGAIDQPVAWLNSGDHIWIKMWAWSLWKGLGWNSIMYLAAIAGIDQEMYEAAKVDGANRWHLIRHITIPSLLPTFFVLLLLSISNIINNGMEQYLVFQNAMNKSTIEVLDLYVYNITIASHGTTMYSFGTAIGILKTFISVFLLFTANFASKKLRGESIV